MSMKLDKLKELRENRVVAELPIAMEEYLERLARLFTGAVNDVLRELTLMNQALPHDIIPLREEMLLVGVAFTIKSMQTPVFSGEMEKRASMLEAITPDSVCVWDTSGEYIAAHWGEMMTAASKQRGCRGAVIDGGLRDTKQVLAQDFPVFYKYRTSNGALGRCKIVDFQVPVMIGGVLIYPGDIIFGDIDGVLVIPRAVAYDVLIRAEEIQKNEKQIKHWIEDEGASATEIVRKGGYF